MWRVSNGRKVDGIQAIKMVILKNEVLDIFLMRGIYFNVENWRCPFRKFEIPEESLDENQGKMVVGFGWHCDEIKRLLDFLLMGLAQFT